MRSDLLCATAALLSFSSVAVGQDLNTNRDFTGLNQVPVSLREWFA
jgi:hypothetical protein